MEYQHWLREAINQLQASESPRRDAEILLEHVTGKGRTYILAFGETHLTDEQREQLDALLARRRAGEPVAHLTGVREFWSLPLFVSPATLIPRPDTECLVEQALTRLPERPCRILDLGTGTGAIAWHWPVNARIVMLRRLTECLMQLPLQSAMHSIWRLKISISCKATGLVHLTSSSLR